MKPRKSPSSAVTAERLKAKLRAVTAERSAALRELDYVHKQLDVVERGAGRKSPAPIKRRERTSKKLEACPVIMASDWHVDEPVDSVGVNGRNEYSPAIANKRIDAMAEAARWLVTNQQQAFAIRDAVVWYGGDLWSGEIHDDLAVTNVLDPAEAYCFALDGATRQLSYLLAQTSLETITVVCTDGNHGRMTHKMMIQGRHGRSLEHLMYLQLAERLKGEKRLRFIVERSELTYLQVYDRTTRWTHGDRITAPNETAIKKAISQWDKSCRADLTMFGHWHTFRDYGTAVGNGSLIGYSRLSVAWRCEPEPPQQGYFLIDSVRGKCLVTPLWVADDASYTTGAGVLSRHGRAISSRRGA